MKIFNKYKGGNIQIISAPRTGSNYLSNIILTSINTPNILINEPLRHKYDKLQYIDNIYIKTKFLKNHYFYTDKIKFNKNIFSHFKTPYIIKHHYNYKNIDVIINSQYYNIFLFRKNLFEMLLSSTISKTVNEWIIPNFKQLFISHNEFNKYFIWTIDKLIMLLNYNIKYDLIIFYENFTFDENNDLFNLGFLPINNYLYKQISGKKFPPKNLIVKNYDEIKKYYFELIKDINVPGITIDGEIIHIDKFKEYE